MNRNTWLHRLQEQLSGWHVWYSQREWFAAPAPADVTHVEAVYLPGRVSARTPQLLRDLCRETYGWDDYCGTCGILARECGHRQPERRVRP